MGDGRGLVIGARLRYVKHAPSGTMSPLRRGAGVVERGGLENRCALSGTVGSNPTLSAIGFSICPGMS